MEIYHRFKAGENRADLAREYGVTYETIHQSCRKIERLYKFCSEETIKKWIENPNFL